MPVRIPIYNQQVTPDLVGQPRAQAGQLTDVVGRQLSEIGNQSRVIADQIQKAQREADLTDRLGRATAELAELEFSFERDQDFRTSPQRFQKGADEIRTRYMQDVQDPIIKQAFTKRYGELALAKSINVRKGAITKEKDYNVAALDTGLDVYATQAANAKNPLERELVENQARIAIATLQTGGWISNVEAGNRERKFLTKLDEATVIRDMSVDPSLAADKLALDPSYASNIDPVQRERWVDQAYRRAESERTRMERDAEKERKLRGDEIMKDAWEKLEKGQLTRDFVANARPFVEPGEYHSLIRGLKEKAGRQAAKNDESALADLHRILYVDNNPAEAERKAFQYQKSGLLKSQTLGSFLSTARSQSRQEGPRTEYERSRQYLTSSLDAGPFSNDPAPKARLGLGLRELDDFVAQGKRSDDEVRKKADDIVKRLQIIDMGELARKTGVGARNDPQRVLDDVAAKAQQLQTDLTNKRITKTEFDRRMTDLNNARKAAEKNLGGK